MKTMRVFGEILRQSFFMRLPLVERVHSTVRNILSVGVVVLLVNVARKRCSIEHENGTLECILAIVVVALVVDVAIADTLWDAHSLR